MDEHTFWFRLWAMLFITVILVVVTLCARDYAVTKKAMECGYAQEVLPGSTEKRWVKK